ncbi:MAG: hypothetical protein H6842_15680, partial [Rhodospirillaceae bacterium]|nr:hypothetical protein [Rhodospirillaceae bacterium]
DPPQRWQRLGHGYGLEIRVVLWEAADVLKLPLTALFRQGDRWAAYVDEAGRAALRPVALGHISGFEAEVLSGIDAGEQVILHPSDRVGEGTRVRLR